MSRPSACESVGTARIQRVITNLLNNAIKHSNKRQEIDIAIWWDGRETVVSITDYGIGIPRHQQAKVFDLYFRAATAPANHYAGLGPGDVYQQEHRRSPRRHNGAGFGGRPGQHVPLLTTND